MSVASQDTFLNLTVPLSVVGSGGIVPGSGVDSVVSGANISTIGASVGDVTVALQPSLTNISSVAFVTGGAISGLSTINGVAVGAAAPVPANPAFSTVSINCGSAVGLIQSGLIEGDPILKTSLSENGYISEMFCQSKGQGSSAAVILGVGPGNNPYDAFFSMDSVQASLQASSNLFLITNQLDLQTNTTNIRGTTNVSTLTAKTLSVSTINGDSYTPLTTTPAFSTVGISSIGPILNAVASPAIQTFNTVIGNMRFQGGTLPAALAPGTTIAWATPFTTVPIVLTGMAGVAGQTAVITVQAAGESSANFSVSSGATGEVVMYLAIGGA